jgi:hypothetical protein
MSTSSLDADAEPWTQRTWSWTGLGITAVCVIVLASVLVPQIVKARNEARRIHSRNNLKQIGLALYNYHDVHETLPIGGSFAADGTPMHGWNFRLVPYLEASSLYSNVNQHLPWDHPVNELRFRISLPVWLNPAFDVRYDRDGHGLTHYMGNPSVFHRNESVSLKEMTAGLRHSWLAGEIAGQFQPWGCTFNWRSLQLPLQNGSAGFGSGYEDGAVQLCLGDGAVRSFHGETDSSILQSLASAPPSVPAGHADLPMLSFEVSSESQWQHLWLAAKDDPFNVQHKGGGRTEVLLDPDGRAYSADVYSRPDKEPAFSSDGSRRIDLPAIVAEYPELRVLEYGVLDRDAATAIRTLTQLEYLVVTSCRLDEQDVVALKKSLPKLRICLKDGTDL